MVHRFVGRGVTLGLWVLEWSESHRNESLRFGHASIGWSPLATSRRARTEPVAVEMVSRPYRHCRPSGTALLAQPLHVSTRTTLQLRLAAERHWRVSRCQQERLYNCV
jgi:hypothetical protein